MSRVPRPVSQSPRTLLPLGIACALFGLIVALMVDDDVILPARETLAVYRQVLGRA